MQLSSASNPSRMETTFQQRTLFFIVLLIGLCLVFAVSYTGRVMAKVRMDNAVSDQGEENRLAQERTAQLQARLTYVQSDAFAEEKAREEFGMTQPGDRKVVILPELNTQPQNVPAPVLVAPAPQPTIPFVEPQRAPAEQPITGPTVPIWRQWLALLFP